MPSYSDLRKGCATSKYARGGRVGKDSKGRTVVNVVLPQPAAPMSPVGGMPAPAAPAPAVPSGGAAAPSGGMMPPAAATMAINHMQGKPGGPGGFARGGRVTVKGGAESGLGRLQKAAKAKKSNGK